MAYKDKGRDRQWHREAMRKRRAMLHPVTPSVTPDKLQSFSQLKQRFDVRQGNARTKPLRPSGEVPLPLYNTALHGPGDRVMVKSPYGNKLVKIVIPELDAGGQPVPNYD